MKRHCSSWLHPSTLPGLTTICTSALKYSVLLCIVVRALCVARAHALPTQNVFAYACNHVEFIFWVLGWLSIYQMDRAARRNTNSTRDCSEVQIHSP